MTARPWLVLLISAGAVTGCVAPAPDTGAYEQKAVMAAQAALSAARSAVLAEREFLSDRMTSAYLDPLLSQAEDSLGSVQTSFDSVQPPAAGTADALRTTLDPLLEQAGSAATDLRIAARRDDTAGMRSAAAQLASTADHLDTFAKEHGG